MLAAAILIIGIIETGSYMEPPKSISSGTARLVQQNISLNQQWTPQSYQQTLADLARISVPHPGEGMPGDPLPPSPKSKIPPDWNSKSKHTIEVKKEGPFKFNFDIVTKK